jgi:hypothetical protein
VGFCFAIVGDISWFRMCPLSAKKTLLIEASEMNGEPARGTVPSQGDGSGGLFLKILKTATRTVPLAHFCLQ